MQTNSSLKQHVSQIEEALARRESSLVDVQTHMEGLVREWQEGEEDYNKRIHNLEEVLQQEKDGQRELRKQVNIYTLTVIVNRQSVSLDFKQKGEVILSVSLKTTNARLKFYTVVFWYGISFSIYRHHFEGSSRRERREL
jgi:chromosome segregation ATPase